MNVSQFWDRHAAHFDDKPDHGLQDPSVRAAWERVLLPLLPAPPATIADLGAGTGSVAILLAQAGYQVSGIDIAPQMVAIARAKASAATVAASFHVGDAVAPPWPSASFDVVLCRHVLWTLPDAPAAVRAWVRLLAPSGRLVLIEGRWPTGEGLTRQQARDLVLAHRQHATAITLNDPDLWGGPIADDRYLLLSTH